jgi:chemotaxis protein histidine kinase CheA
MRCSTAKRLKSTDTSRVRWSIKSSGSCASRMLLAMAVSGRFFPASTTRSALFLCVTSFQIADILARVVDENGHQLMDRRRLGRGGGGGGGGALQSKEQQKEKKVEEQKEREAKDQKEREAKEQKEREAKEQKERATRERQERAFREHQQRQERATRERQERAFREEQERAAREQQERAFREEQERAARERQARAARYHREEQERAAREEQERAAREQQEAKSYVPCYHSRSTASSSGRFHGFDRLGRPDEAQVRRASEGYWGSSEDCSSSYSSSSRSSGPRCLDHSLDMRWGCNRGLDKWND